MKKIAEEIQIAIIQNQLDITGWNVSPNSTMITMIKTCMEEYKERHIAPLIEACEAFVNSTYIGCSKEELNALRIQAETALLNAKSLLSKLQEFHPDSVIVGNDFPGDGLGVAVQNSKDTYTSIDEAIELIKKNGHLSIDDFTSL